MYIEPKVIIALDMEDITQLNAIVNQLNPAECRLKIGKTLFTRFGPEWVKQLHLQGFEIFLDLKFHDIPQQIYGACLAAAELGVWMLNVHALGGLAMLKAARSAVDKAAENLKTPPKLIGVTLLTSLGANDLAQLGIQGSVDDTVMRLAKLCADAHLDGVVCSAKEAVMLKKAFGAGFLCVTPGIRLPEDDKDDQQRVTTPQEAIAAGSDYLVIGRTITYSASPSKVLHQINESICL